MLIYIETVFFSLLMKRLALMRTRVLDASCFCLKSFFALLSLFSRVLFAFSDALRPFYAVLRLCLTVPRPRRKERKMYYNRRLNTIGKLCKYPRDSVSSGTYQFLLSLFDFFIILSNDCFKFFTFFAFFFL